MGANKLKVLVGSKNPTKIKAVSEAFKRVFKKNSVVVSGVGVPSGVSDQPMGSNETKTGAENRLKNLKTHLADFYVGIERFETEGRSAMSDNDETDTYRNGTIVANYGRKISDILKFIL